MPPDLALWLTLSGSNYPYLKQIIVVPGIWAIEVRLYFTQPITFSYTLDSRYPDFAYLE